MAAIVEVELPQSVLFDEQAFQQQMVSGQNPIQVYKSFLNQGLSVLKDRFFKGHPSRQLVHRQAWLIDQLLKHAWQSIIDFDRVCLIAVGGYGRGELCPASDIDLMILHKNRLRPEHQQQISEFITLLWDIGLEVGHSVRSVRDCVREAKLDITVATNIMECRLLLGDETLYASMRRATGPKKIWPTRKFFAAKVKEQQERHEKYDNSEYKLEPNIKEAPGGLRDIQIIGWVAKRHYDVERLHHLIDEDFMTPEEYQTLSECRDFLWQVRYALHTITEHREDRLLFDYQSKVAELFGYSNENNEGIERLMRQYYNAAFEVSRLNDILLQHFEEEIVYARRWDRVTPLNRRFQIRNDFIEAKHDKVFEQNPWALMEIFLLLQQHNKLHDVRASTIRLIRQHLHLIDDEFRNDIRNKSLFMEIMKQPRLVGHELRRMHRYGVLGAYIPCFGQIQGMMQFDLFHVYTVEEHTLFVVRNLRRFKQVEAKDEFPLCYELMPQIAKPQLLYLAGLFHDIAKGRNGDHSTLGAEDAYQFCQHHELSDFDSKLVAWLVEHHLFMSRTSQREDIEDPEVIQKFAERIGDRERLKYLYLLTVADICGTNPQLWNSWKASLLVRLYRSTQRFLRRGTEVPIEKEQRIANIRSSARSLINQRITEKIDVEDIWDKFGDDFFMRHSPDEIAWRTERIANHKDLTTPLVAARSRTEKGGSEIFIYMPDRDNIFTTSTRTMKQLGLNILDARIITTKDGYTLNSYIVLEKDGHLIGHITSKKEIIDSLKEALKSLEVVSAKISRIQDKKLQSFRRATDITFSSDTTNNWTVMEINTLDFPGLLACIGIGLQSCEVRLRGAKVATHGELAEDIFYLTNRDNQLISDQKKLDCLIDSINDSIAKYANS